MFPLSLPTKDCSCSAQARKDVSSVCHALSPDARGAGSLRFDFRTGVLYEFTSGRELKIYKLDSEGYPAGSPTISQLVCGEVRDAIVDETTGKVYVACSQPPAVKE